MSPLGRFLSSLRPGFYDGERKKRKNSVGRENTRRGGRPLVEECFGQLPLSEFAYLGSRRLKKREGGKTERLKKNDIQKNSRGNFTGWAGTDPRTRHVLTSWEVSFPQALQALGYCHEADRDRKKRKR